MLNKDASRFAGKGAQLMGSIKSMHEGKNRSALKAFSWRVIATTTGMSLVYLFTGKMELIAGFGIGDVALKVVFYFIHERLWNRVSFGRTLAGTVESPMRTPAVTVRPSEPISRVVNSMVSAGVGAVVVTEGDDRPVGIITEQDILDRVIEAGADPSKVSAEEVMSSPVETVEQDRSLSDMLELMHGKDVRRLAVTRNEKLVGVVTERRVLDTLLFSRTH